MYRAGTGAKHVVADLLVGLQLAARLLIQHGRLKMSGLEGKMKAHISSRFVEERLEEGLLLFGTNRVDEAIVQWRSVLVVCPGEPRALDYLLSAGSALAAHEIEADDAEVPRDIPRDRSGDGDGELEDASAMWLTRPLPVAKGRDESAFDVAAAMSTDERSPDQAVDRGAARVVDPAALRDGTSGHGQTTIKPGSVPSGANPQLLELASSRRSTRVLIALWPYAFLPLVIAVGAAVGYGVWRSAEEHGRTRANGHLGPPSRDARSPNAESMSGLARSARGAEPTAQEGVGERADTFVVSLSVRPRSARIDLDGVEVGRGSINSTLRRDGSRHTVRMSAPGYEPHEVEFTDEAPPEDVRLRRREITAAARPKKRAREPSRPEVGPERDEVKAKPNLEEDDPRNDWATRPTDNLDPWSSP